MELLALEPEVEDRPDAVALPAGPGAVAFEGVVVRLRPGAADPARHRLPPAARPPGGRGRPHRCRASRPSPACCSASTTRPRGRVLVDGHDLRERHPGLLARGHRRRAAGHGPVQRHDRLQSRLRPPRRLPSRDRGRGRGGRSCTSSSPACPTATTRGRRARPQAVGRREAARGAGPRHPQAPAHPDPRRGDLGPGQRHRAGDPEEPARPRRRHHAGRSPTASPPSSTPTRSSSIDRGRIVERGTHDRLLRLGGLYADLWRRQSTREKLAPRLGSSA